MATERATGEPYELAGKRLVFTNWYYVRPGGFGWYDDGGNNVTVSGSEGPWGAHFRRFDYPHGIRLVVQSAERLGPLLQPEHPWEEKGISISTLICDREVYRGWGVSAPAEGGSLFCYLESGDGLAWTRPNVGIYEWNGSRDNNILADEGGTVFIDPSAPPAERYKWVSERWFSRETYDAYRQRRPNAWEPRADRVDVGSILGVQGAVSPDGLHWNVLPEPLVMEHSDTQVVAYYDERLRKYILYTRNWMVGPRSGRALDGQGLSWLGVGRRSIGRTESDDFRCFPLSEVILEPGPDMLPSDVLYTNCKTTIPGAPDHHLMFPAIWHTSDDTTSIALASSHDGKLWHFLPGSPVLETSPFGEWDGGCIFAHPNLVELPDGRFALPYTGYIFPHKYPRGQWKFQPGYAVWPKGRLVALEAPERGEFATVGIIPPGRKLRINALTQRVGGILVEVAGLDGKPLEQHTFADSTPIIGDHHHAPVTWEGRDDLGYREGAGIILRFRMEKAKVFWLEFE
ncbi:MAG: hypothetical protein ACUVXI_11575 [bacterium]